MFSQKFEKEGKQSRSDLTKSFPAKKATRDYLKLLLKVTFIISIVLFLGGIIGVCWLDALSYNSIFGFSEKEFTIALFAGTVIFIATGRFLSAIYYDDPNNSDE